MTVPWECAKAALRHRRNAFCDFWEVQFVGRCDSLRLTVRLPSGNIHPDRAVSARQETRMFGLGPMELGIILVIAGVRLGL